jgi:hypothetical protein
MNIKFFSLLAVLFLFSSTMVSAFGELQNNQYQTVSTDLLKSLGNVFSGTPLSITAPASGCTEKYEYTSTGATFPQNSFPISISCSASSLPSNYYCRIYTVTYGANYNNRNYHTTYAKIDGGQTSTMGWYGDANQVYQQYVVDYYSWTCPSSVTPQCSGSYGVQKCGNIQAGNTGTNQRIYEQCSGGVLTKTFLEDCGYNTCILNNGVTQCTYVAPCLPAYNPGMWDVCQSNSQQTRTVTIDTCGKTKIETQGCTYNSPQPSCTPNWQMGSWNACNPNNIQTRSVVDANNCGTALNQPASSQNCQYQQPTLPPNCPLYALQPPCASNEVKTVTQQAYMDSNGCSHSEAFTCASQENSLPPISPFNPKPADDSIYYWILGGIFLIFFILIIKNRFIG